MLFTSCGAPLIFRNIKGVPLATLIFNFTLWDAAKLLSSSLFVSYGGAGIMNSRVTLDTLVFIGRVVNAIASFSQATTQVNSAAVVEVFAVRARGLKRLGGSTPS